MDHGQGVLRLTTLSPIAVRVFAETLESRSGQQLTDNRLWRLDATLNPLLRTHGIESLDRLAAMIAGNRDPGLADAVADALLNHESFFFRDPVAFEQLTELIEGPLRTARSHARRLRIWSAGCSTGQEAYSLAMGFAERPDLWGDWTIDIVATDVSAAVIDQARAGVYTQFEIQRGLPVRRMLRWFETRDEDWHAVADLRRRVRFSARSLLSPWEDGRRFDVVLCRNVLLYFSQEVRSSVFGVLRSAIEPDGVLMLGAGETVLGQTILFESHPDARGFFRPATDATSH